MKDKNNMKTVKDLRAEGSYVIATFDGEEWFEIIKWDSKNCCMTYFKQRDIAIPISLHNKLNMLLEYINASSHIYFRYKLRH